MKKGKKLLALLAGLALGTTAVMGFAACGEEDDPNDFSTADIAGTYEFLVWSSEVEVKDKDGNVIASVPKVTEKQIARFNETNEFGVTINAKVVGVPEGEAATQMITSVEDGADMFFFAQDQTMRLMNAGALQQLGKKTSETIKSRNDASSIAAATVGDGMYCYPLTSDNGYFMFYDKSVVKEEHVDSLEDIIADCEEKGRLFSYELGNSGWYNAGFFFGAGCHSTWTTDNDGKFKSVDDNFNSDAGVVALKGMQKVMQSSAYHDSSNTADFGAAIPSAVVISGTWGAKEAQNKLGANYGVADLPSFTVDGKSYHIGSFSGNKLLGLKPQVDVKRAAVLQQLALYLTNDECQLERFTNFGWGPSNKTAQQNEAVKADAALVALAQQSTYAVPQGQIHGSWWDMAKAYAASAKAATKDDTAALKGILKTYADGLNALFNMDDAAKNAWTVIGTMNGDNFSKDLPMTEISTGIWKSNDAFDLAVGDKFKCRKGANWDNAVPASDYVVETAGKYYIQIDTSTGDITLVAAE